MVNSFLRLPQWVRANKFFHKDLSKVDSPLVECSPLAANLVSSHSRETSDEILHHPILDIDMGCKVLPSTTPGHNHLFIDKELTTEQYDKLLRVLVEVGIVQKGVLELQWEKEGHTAVRMPGEVKQKNHTSSGGPEPTPNPAADIQPSPTLAEWKKEMGLETEKPNDIISVNEMKGNVNFSSITPTEKVKIDWTLIKEDDLTDDLKPGIVVFNNLAEVAKNTGEAIHSVVLAWKEYINQAPVEDQNEKSSISTPADLFD